MKKVSKRKQAARAAAKRRLAARGFDVRKIEAFAKNNDLSGAAMYILKMCGGGRKS